MAPESTPTHNLLSVEYISLGSLQPDPGNARLHDKRQIRQIAESIKAFGFNAQVS